MLLLIDTEKCKRDGICVKACGRRIIEMKDQEAVPTPVAGAEELCVNCGHCVAACPTGALSLDTMKSEDCPDIRKNLMISVEQAEQFFHSRRSIDSRFVTRKESRPWPCDPALSVCRRQSDACSEGGVTQTNALSLPIFNVRSLRDEEASDTGPGAKRWIEKLKIKM